MKCTKCMKCIKTEGQGHGRSGSTCSDTATHQYLAIDKALSCTRYPYNKLDKARHLLHRFQHTKSLGLQDRVQHLRRVIIIVIIFKASRSSFCFLRFCDPRLRFGLRCFRFRRSLLVRSPLLPSCTLTGIAGMVKRNGTQETTSKVTNIMKLAQETSRHVNKVELILLANSLTNPTTNLTTPSTGGDSMSLVSSSDSGSPQPLSPCKWRFPSAVQPVGLPP